MGSGGFARVALILAAGIVAGCSSSSSSPAAGDAGVDAGPGPLLVQTDHGPVQGIAVDGVRRFGGIPFAAPPVGSLRWKPPADPAHWTSPLDASKFGSACEGLSLIGGMGLQANSSEDCLRVNVWAPMAKTTRAPVMVWIYGGGFIGGDGSDPSYDGTSLVTTQNVIVVNLNYRLGPLGFLSSAALAAEEGVSTAPSFGLLDQQAALKWVHANIAAFGGDPDNVTLFGESAGAFSTCIQLTLPGSKGLFAHAIIESGACDGFAYFTPSAAQSQGEQLAQALGCTDASTELSCLRGKDAGAVTMALPIRKALIGPTGFDWGPVVDGVALPALPLDSIKAGHFANVPVIVGSNHDEGNLFTFLWAFDGGPAIMTSDELAIAQTLYSQTQATTIVNQYSGAAYPTPADSVSAAFTDGFFACPTRRTARAIAGAGGAAYLYQFTHPFNPALAPNLGAAHSFEIPYVWGNRFLGSATPDSDAPLVAAMQGYWGRFAATGDPNGGGATMWPKYTSSDDENVALDLKVTTNTGLKKSACDFWDGLP